MRVLQHNTPMYLSHCHIDLATPRIPQLSVSQLLNGIVSMEAFNAYDAYDFP